jgi:sugar O-acyltransferase (sialic acid O-acetyltransferase NeuD family)
MKAITIVGAGGLGKNVVEILRDCNKVAKLWDILGYIDEDASKYGTQINGVPVLGGLKWLQDNKYNYNDLGCVCAIAEPEIRRKLVDAISATGVGFHTIIHPTAIVSDFAEIGCDVIISSFSLISANSKIGNHAYISTGCVIGEDTIIDSYCRVSPKTTISGSCHIKEGVFIGVGTTIIQNRSIGAWATVGAGSLVLKDIPAGVIAFGMPAAVIKEKTNRAFKTSTMDAACTAA